MKFTVYVAGVVDVLTDERTDGKWNECWNRRIDGGFCRLSGKHCHNQEQRQRCHSAGLWNPQKPKADKQIGLRAFYPCTHLH